MLFVVCILSWGEVLEDAEHVFRGSLHVFRGSLHVFRGTSFGLLLWWFCSLCTDGVEPFLPPLRGVSTSSALK